MLNKEIRPTIRGTNLVYRGKGHDLTIPIALYKYLRRLGIGIHDHSGLPGPFIVFLSALGGKTLLGSRAVCDLGAKSCLVCEALRVAQEDIPLVLASQPPWLTTHILTWRLLQS